MGNKHARHEFPRRGEIVWASQEGEFNPKLPSDGKVIFVDRDSGDVTIEFKRTRWVPTGTTLIYNVDASIFYGRWRSDSRRFVIPLNLIL